jgi:hypothetical protein
MLKNLSGKEADETAAGFPPELSPEQLFADEVAGFRTMPPPAAPEEPAVPVTELSDIARDALPDDVRRLYDHPFRQRGFELASQSQIDDYFDRLLRVARKYTPERVQAIEEGIEDYLRTGAYVTFTRASEGTLMQLHQDILHEISAGRAVAQEITDLPESMVREVSGHPPEPIAPPVEQPVVEQPPAPTPEAAPTRPVSERPVTVVRRTPSGKIDILPGKQSLLQEIDRAIATAPADADVEFAQEQVTEHGTTRSVRIPQVEKIEFKIDGGVQVFNTKETLQTFRKRVAAMPMKMVKSMFAKKAPVPKAVAATRERVDELVRGAPEGYYTDGSSIVKGTPPRGAKFGEREVSPEAIMGVLNTPTESAQLQYYLSIFENDIGVSNVPIASLKGLERERGEGFRPLAVFKSGTNYFAFNQERLNAIRKRHPDATYAMSTENEGQLVAKVQDEPVGALMGLHLPDQETVAMTDPPGLPDAIEMGIVEAKIPVEQPPPGTVQEQSVKSEQQFIDESPPIGMSIRQVVPKQVEIVKPDRDLVGARSLLRWIEPVRTIAGINPVAEKIARMGRDTMTRLGNETLHFNDRIDAAFKGLNKDETKELIGFLEQKDRPADMPPKLDPE